LIPKTERYRAPGYYMKKYEGKLEFEEAFFRVW